MLSRKKDWKSKITIQILEEISLNDTQMVLVYCVINLSYYLDEVYSKSLEVRQNISDMQAFSRLLEMY